MLKHRLAEIMVHIEWHQQDLAKYRSPGAQAAPAGGFAVPIAMRVAPGSCSDIFSGRGHVLNRQQVCKIAGQPLLKRPGCSLDP
jgi:hypothetical protein